MLQNNHYHLHIICPPVAFKLSETITFICMVINYLPVRPAGQTAAADLMSIIAWLKIKTKQHKTENEL